MKNKSLFASFVKKAAATTLTAAMMVSLAACGGKAESAPASQAQPAATEAAAETEAAATEAQTEAAPELKEIDTLKVMVSPYQDADVLLNGLSDYSDMLKKEMEAQGYKINNVDLTVGTSYSVVGEALSAGTVDVGFVSGGTYVTYDDECEILLTALREAINKDSLDPKDWNDGTPEEFTKNLTTYYRSVILAGSSEKGKAIADKINAGEEVSWEELDSATWAVMGASSASGYIYPSLWLYNKYGKQISDLSHVVQSDSYTTSMSRLAAEQVDIIVGYAHIRAKLGPKWESDLGGTGDVYEKTNVIAVTDQIMDDTICVSMNSDIVDDDFKKAFGNAMIHIGETEEGLAVLKVLSHVGYRFAEASDYDPERAAQEMLKK